MINHICEACGDARDITKIAGEWVDDGYARCCPRCVREEAAAKARVQERLDVLRPQFLNEELVAIRTERGNNPGPAGAA